MFDRGNKGGEAQGPAPVEITLEDGQELKGRLSLPPGRTLVDVLNGTATFVEFEVNGGERMYIAKSALHCVKPMNVPAAPDLWAGPTDGSGFDPSQMPPNGHYGLVGMKERAALINGSLQIDSQPGRGTIVQLTVPLQEIGT